MTARSSLSFIMLVLLQFQALWNNAMHEALFLEMMMMTKRGGAQRGKEAGEGGRGGGW